MSDNEIKPVAVLRETEFGRYWSTNIAVNCLPLGDYYDQSAIARLMAERDNYHEHLGDVVSRLQRAEAERDAAVADARRWNELCRQIDAGTFPSVVIEDAMEMGSGALELQVDASMAEGLV